jgi:REP element-mobilizing transposase RayT
VSIFIHKSHNVTVLLYHLVCVCKGRDEWLTGDVVAVLKNTCLELEKRYEIHFLEIGTDFDHVHFLIQSVPMYSPTKIARTVKSITAREILKQIPTLRPKLWGGEFWSNGYYINTVGRTNSETTIQKYIKNQGHNFKNYNQIHKDQLTLFI